MFQNYCLCVCVSKCLCVCVPKCLSVCVFQYVCVRVLSRKTLHFPLTLVKKASATTSWSDLLSVSDCFISSPGFQFEGEEAVCGLGAGKPTPHQRRDADGVERAIVAGTHAIPRYYASAFLPPYLHRHPHLAAQHIRPTWP